MGEFDAPGSLWAKSDYPEDNWRSANEIDEKELGVPRTVQHVGGKVQKTLFELLVSDFDISPEIVKKLMSMASDGYLRLNGMVIRGQGIHAFVEALNRNDVVYALYGSEEDNCLMSIYEYDLSTEDIPLIDDLNELEYKLLGVYASIDEAEGEL